MYTFLMVVQVLAAVSLIGLILLQQGKGADAGAAFGSGASGTVFGSRGSANFLSRSTAWIATVFFGASLALAYVVHGQSGVKSVVDTAQPAAAQLPAKNAPAPEQTAPAQAVPAQPQPAEQAPKVPE